MNIEKCIAAIRKNISEVDTEYDNKLVTLKKNFDRNVYYLNKLEDVLPSLTAVLEKEGFEIGQIRPIKTGSTSDWMDTDYLSVSLTLIPISDKVRFIKFAGYTKSGAGKNQDALRKKAKKLTEAITNNTIGLFRVDVNSYSFEIKKDGEKKTVSATIWIK
jgi:hypothetical protein